MRDIIFVGQGPRWLLAISAVVACLGCDSGPEVVQITGRVTYQGRPVKDFAVIFVSERGGRPSMGQTDQEGKYELVYTADAKGAQLGRNKVYLRYNPTTMEASAAFQAGQQPADVQAIQSKYGDENTTPLVFEIKESQVLDLEL
jgi:hypothetical protein